MALPFTDEQRQQIRMRLFESAQRHIMHDGVMKTSLDTLTSEAGISKSSFYKFYESKEQLFLEVAGTWEEQILSGSQKALASGEGMSSKERAARFVYAVFETIHQLGLVRFLREDLPQLNSFLPEDEARAHCLTSAKGIFDALQAAKIRFTAPDEVVLSVIQLMYLSILSIGDIGENFFPALHELVVSACDRLVA
ncbi:MAG: TetR/AcrR family transcriptional regulator [Clostridiales bacterium]|nr:TetR/AcrR family transcriptional regulator [Clostridiales bacterium]